MQRTLVYSDPHQQWRKVRTILRHWKDRVIMLGDWFDSKREGYDCDVASTAWFIKDSLDDPNNITLLGNHDLSYILPIKRLVSCGGYSEYKYDKINSIFSLDDWSKFKLFHAEEDFWFSHAGIVSDWFADPELGVTEEVIKQKLKDAWQLLYAGTLEGSECIHAIGKGRDGKHALYEKGGILWADETEAELHPYITQVFGHSYSRKIKTTAGQHNSRNIKVDTDLGRCIIIEEDNSITEVNLWLTPSPQ